mgnify:CR=1 FL=1
MDSQRFFSEKLGYLKNCAYVVASILSFLFYLLGHLWRRCVAYFVGIPFVQRLSSPRYGTNLVSRFGRVVFMSRFVHSLFGGSLAGVACLAVYYNVTIASFDGNYYISFGTEGSPAYAQESQDVLVAIAEIASDIPISTESTEEELTSAGKSENRNTISGSIRAGRITEEKALVPANFVPSGSFISPLRNPPRLLVTTRFTPGHPGIDLSTEMGTPLYSIADGVVASTGSSIWAYGKVVMIDHGNGIQSLYAHMSRIDVKAGDYVSQNSLIGAVGSTGNSTGPHVHLEVHKDGRAINPAGFVVGI